MWRSRKSDVRHEMVLPPCTHETILVRFGRVESAFYAREAGRLRARVAPVLAKWEHEAAAGAGGAGARESEAPKWEHEAAAGAGGAGARESEAPAGPTLTAPEARRVLPTLALLRQACVHPQLSLSAGARAEGRAASAGAGGAGGGGGGREHAQGGGG
jgi:hypothetical protein